MKISPTRSWLAGGALLALGACSNPYGPGLELELQQATALWQRSAMVNYQFEMRRSCFCGFADAGHRVRVTVQNGAVVEAYNIDLEASLTPEQRVAVPTIDGLLTIIRDAFDQSADRVRVRYDGDTGAPISIYIDYNRQAVDDELSISVYSVDRVLAVARGGLP